MYKKEILIDTFEEFGKQNGRLYRALGVWKKDKRYKNGLRKIYLRAEWLEREPYVKMKNLPMIDYKVTNTD